MGVKIHVSRIIRCLLVVEESLEVYHVSKYT